MSFIVEQVLRFEDCNPPFISYYRAGGSGSGFGYSQEQAKVFKTLAGCTRAINRFRVKGAEYNIIKKA